MVKATRTILRYSNFKGSGDFWSDWNKYGKHFGTNSTFKAAPLANIDMAQANEVRTPVTHVKYFEPDNRSGVCVSREEWGARIFTPDIPQILHDAKIEDKKTKERFKRSKRLEGRFSFNGRDLSKNVKGVNNKEDGV